MVRITPISIVWAVHFHQPLGNFPEVISRYVERSLRPFITVLARHPRIKITLHISGVLLVYLKDNHEDLITLITELVEHGQVELLGGGFYEPIFSLIPQADVEAQLQLMCDWLEQEFQTTPRGVWLPESVWEPHFTSLLHKAGMDYTLLDESIFSAAGWKRAQLFHPFRTQYLNDHLTIFPVHRQWSRQIPLQNMRDIKATFTQLARRQDRQMVILAQNGDQYGIWPDTHHNLYELGALEEWLIYLQNEQDWIQTLTLDQGRAGRWPLVYLPSGSMTDLEPCSMSSTAHRGFLEARADLQRRFDADRFVGYMRGGAWLNFFAKYAEAHLMQNKLVWLHRQIHQLPRGGAREEAEAKILEAEEHSAYWHAESGGVYANYLRDAIYQRLIAAEKIMLADQDDSRPPLVQTDYNGDGDDEMVLRTDLCGLVAVPNYGGSLSEFNFWPSDYNLANTFRRRQEAYFTPDLPSHLTVEDWHERRMFQDHFVPRHTTLSQFQQGTFVEFGDFINQAYEIIQGQYTQETCSVTLERKGGLYQSGEQRSLTCQKSYQLTSPGTLKVTYHIFNSSPLPTDCLFVSEINYTLLDGHSVDRRIRFDQQQVPCGQTLEIPSISAWVIEDVTRNLRWTWSLHLSASLWHFPILTPTRVNGAWSENYQGSVLLLVWPLHLAPGQSVEYVISSHVDVIAPD